MTALDLLILSLATWRLAYLVAREDAPFAFMRKLRERYPLGGLLSCVNCVSVWVAIALYIVWLTPAYLIVYPLALSGLALMLHRYTGYFTE